MSHRRASGFLVVCCLLSTSLFAQELQAGKNSLILRGQRQDIYYYRAKKSSLGKVLFAPGDGGWRGFAITIAADLASHGYDVYGLDTRRYLESFTGATVLTPSQIATDFRHLAEWACQGNANRVLLVGWSEGAGLALAAATNPQNQTFQGLIAVGMTEYNILALRWSDVMSQITKKLPNEPTFRSIDLIEKVSPLPLTMIASTHDEYVSVSTTQQLFAKAREPKRLILIEAENHKFDGKTDEFFRVLNENLEWVQKQNP